MKETPKFPALNKALEGKNTQLAMFMIEMLYYDHVGMDTEWLITADRAKDLNKEELLEKFTTYYSHMSQSYSIVHSLDDSHSCYSSHDVWRMWVFETYMKNIEEGLHDDQFELINDDTKAELAVWYTSMAKEDLIREH